MDDQITDFQSRFKKIPNIIDLDHLTVTGDVHFGRGVTLRGTVIGRCLGSCLRFVECDWNFCPSGGERRSEDRHSGWLRAGKS